jgi:hypothetical protein
MSLTLNLPTGSVRFPCELATAQALKTALDRLMQSLKIVATPPTIAGKPSPQPNFEYQNFDRVFLEVFCNPNQYPSPYAAKVLLTVKDTDIRLVVETELTQMLEDVTQFLESAQ